MYMNFLYCHCQQGKGNITFDVFVEFWSIQLQNQCHKFLLNEAHVLGCEVLKCLGFATALVLCMFCYR